MDELKKCIICGKTLVKNQKKYCSKKCYGKSKQGYKTCPVCGKKFPEWERSLKICCSKECSKKNREEMYKRGVYSESIDKMRKGHAEKIKEIGPDNFWIAKGWVIQSPEGEIFECRNLLNFIRENPDLFDGTTKQAFDGIVKIKASYQGKRKNPCFTWKGWKLLDWND